MKTEVKTNKRFWRRGNVLDVVILLLLLAAIVSIGYRYYLANEAADADELDDYEITFRAENVLPGVVDALRAGDVIYLSDGEAMGTLGLADGAQGNAPVVTEAAETLVRDAQGNYVSVTLPDASYLDVQGIVKCQGVKDENGTLLLGGDRSVTPGQKLTVHTEKATLVLTVMSIAKD